jgi:rhodanese-related sulfurtransferase
MMAAPTVSAAELRDDSDAILLDVRTGAEHDSVHISGSVNVPLDRLDEFAPALAGLGAPIVCVCQTGNRAQQALQKLVAAGAPNVKVLDGGIVAWEGSGGPVERGPEKWAMDRQVRGVAGSLVLAGLVLGTRFRRARALAWMVGAGLTWSAISNSCYMAMALAKLPYNRSERDCAADVEALVASRRPAPLRATA